MINDGQYDPMESSRNGSVMHSFVGSSTVYEWLLDQEEFFIDVYPTLSPDLKNGGWRNVGESIAAALIASNQDEASKCLEALIGRGCDVNDSCGWIIDEGESPAHLIALGLTSHANNLDYPKRFKVLCDAGIDFHARNTHGLFEGTLEILLASGVRFYNATNKYNKDREERVSIPKPPTGSTRRVMEYDILDPTLNIKYRPRTSRMLWRTWHPELTYDSEGIFTSNAIGGLLVLESTQRYLDAWMEVLLEAGLDIADYGRREDQLHPEGVLKCWFGEARVVFEYGSHVNGCRIHVMEIWMFDWFDDDESDEEEETTPAETSEMPCSWDSDNE